jgi:hypothetical protein
MLLGMRTGEHVIAGFLVQRREWHSGCEKVPRHGLMADHDLATPFRHVCAAAARLTHSTPARCELSATNAKSATLCP